ncbi:KH domain-containing protein [Histomonas meleagridis]|uniref:KH domain-containing protein n=1 Tax=Histomonas meleagridis TaxID=135588 RepID=UPI0035594AB9|nr:KH domain-containing protein [Histomonas meleagridis]KAH0805700.1 KH domain-containing protein [Histomonas meleagridis]
MESLKERIPVDCVSDANFNVVAHLEGPNNQNLHYIEDQSHCRLTVHGAINSGFSLDEEGPIYILLMANSPDDIEKGKDLCLNLISTVKAQKQKILQEKAQKRAKKRKAGSKTVNLPEQFLLAMRYYFPGEPAEPPPPGSTQDMKLHRRKFRIVAKHNSWFTN